MRLALLIAWVSMLGLVSGGCQIGNSDQQAEVESTPASPTASPTTPEASPSPTAATNFSNPVTPEQTEERVAVSGLFQTLPPEAVVPQIEQGRNDPFAAITVQPVVTLPPNSGATARPVRSLPQIAPPSRGTTSTTRNSTRNSPAVARNNRLPSPKPAAGSTSIPKTGNRATSGQSRSTPKTGSGATGNGATGTGVDDIPVAVAPFAPELPVLPEPEQARGVEITGVIQVGGVPSAIVKVPNEPDRYVRVGQRLSNGQVLVKRIEMNRGPEPVVILEQYGIEVAKRVGDKSAGA